MQSITVQELEHELKEHTGDASVDFINVCTPQEYAEAHIPGVRSVPLSDLGQHLNEFKDKRTIYVHCRSGGRSRMAIQALHDMGISAELVNVEGGILAWTESGKPLNRT
ncbi:MAG: rhodanese-like protein [Parcubacteria group bacterium Athens0416_74]|jgi:rhodanese-related sulfurtransferase|nr:MAG: rhodanese-like protein [Parcubacteria group bacterium Athens0416_74]